MTVDGDGLMERKFTEWLCPLLSHKTSHPCRVLQIYHVVKAALTCLVVSDVFDLSESFFKSSDQRTLNPAMLVSKSYAHTKFWRGMYVVGSTVESIDRIVFQLRNVLAQAI